MDHTGEVHWQDHVLQFESLGSVGLHHEVADHLSGSRVQEVPRNQHQHIGGVGLGLVHVHCYSAGIGVG